MENLNVALQNPKQLSPLTLAFLGDAVFELLVREQIAVVNRPVNELHRAAVRRVKAGAQARAMDTLLPHLTEEESEVFRRGRNAHTSHSPKGASVAEYHAATGLEALFGYLYLCGRIDRLNQLFRLISF